MFNFFLKQLLLRKTLHENKGLEENTHGNGNMPNDDSGDLFAGLEENVNQLVNMLGNSTDIVVRELVIGHETELKAVLVYISGLVDSKIVNENIILPLMGNPNLQEISKYKTVSFLKSTILTVGIVREEKSMHRIVSSILSGYTVLLLDGSREVLLIDTVGSVQRDISLPTSESSVRGPQEAFIENLASNLVLLRKKIQNQNFTVETMVLGKQSRTKVSVVYLKNIVNPDLLDEVRYRLGKISVDAILGSGYIEQYIEDAPFSPFSTIGNTEKPDVVAAKILEGRAAIIVDGTPFVLTVPRLMIENFQTAEDYYSRPYYASFIRLLRLAAFFISILSPAVYVALTTFHQELIPTPLLITMAASREGKPLPAVVEVLIMGVVYEILREAGVRLPRPVGSAISIVGALVVGQAAVEAGLITAPMVIVTAVTAIATFVVTPLTDAAVLLRFFLIFTASILGGFGIVGGLLVVLVHLCSLRSFGTPYFSPFAPLNFNGLKDSIIRMPLWTMLTRPTMITWDETNRQKAGFKPEPPDEE
ncbi:spore germination protein [Paenibacillus sp. Soil522]|uniref:spore germination protein n=1 Tax=Paenibacillus sp. Soil522 TaxID=1736388 RepID=UPI0006FCBE3E|nr:spore germination protein [Paenibacillus sp. Soil522]KRE34627.1 spore gernimation protein KA [Paenibacillus sp. Soil522]